MQKIRKGDQVVVTTGRRRASAARCCASSKRQGPHRGREPREEAPAPQPVKGQTGGIIDKEMPFDISNVMLVNPATGKGDRVGFKYLEPQGGARPRKVRFFKSNGEVVDV
jgi:large subunit ribosomal protein L24